MATDHEKVIQQHVWMAENLYFDLIETEETNLTLAAKWVCLQIMKEKYGSDNDSELKRVVKLLRPVSGMATSDNTELVKDRQTVLARTFAVEVQ